MVVLLKSAPPVLIHGEYYSSNILYRNEIVYPVDWESAAMAAGEIDLAALTERWPPEIVRQCELEYQRARWPEGSPADFERTLAVAKLYLHFRWLGDRPESTVAEYQLWRFEDLHSVSERLGDNIGQRRTILSLLCIIHSAPLTFRSADTIWHPVRREIESLHIGGHECETAQ